MAVLLTNNVPCLYNGILWNFSINYMNADELATHAKGITIIPPHHFQHFFAITPDLCVCVCVHVYVYTQQLNMSTNLHM
jgi:hypothetical protein